MSVNLKKGFHRQSHNVRWILAELLWLRQGEHICSPTRPPPLLPLPEANPKPRVCVHGFGKAVLPGELGRQKEKQNREEDKAEHRWNARQSLTKGRACLISQGTLEC